MNIDQPAKKQKTVEIMYPNENKEVANSVLEFFANPNTLIPNPEHLHPNFTHEDETLLTYAIRNVNVDAVISILDAKADPNLPNKKGVTPISAAAHRGNIPIMNALIKAGAKVNALNTSGSTALIQASHFGHVEAVRLLLKHGSLADFANLKGTTALMRACQEGRIEISALLVLAKGDVNRKNLEGMNALMLASQRGHANVVELLIRAGAVMDEQTSQGSTALMLACKRGHEKVVNVLVSMGAEIYMKDNRNRTAAETAVRRQHEGLVQYLNTQEQIKKFQWSFWNDRNILIRRFRDARLSGKLVLNLNAAVSLRIAGAITRRDCQESIKNAKHASSEIYVKSYCDEVEKYREIVLNESNIDHKFDDSSRSTIPLFLRTAVSVLQSEKYRDKSTFSFPLAKPREQYSDWKWAALFLRCLDLTPGVFELVMEFLPLPRIWRWSLGKLKRRVNLAANIATKDLSIMLNEMIWDMGLIVPPTLPPSNFATSILNPSPIPSSPTSTAASNFGASSSITLTSLMSSTSTLMKLKGANDLIYAISVHWGIPLQLVKLLAQWGDVQSVSLQYSDEFVSFSSLAAKRFYTLTNAMYKHMRFRSSAPNLLKLSDSIIEGQMDMSDAQSINRTSISMSVPCDVCDVSPVEEAFDDSILPRPSSNDPEIESIEILNSVKKLLSQYLGPEYEEDFDERLFEQETTEHDLQNVIGDNVADGNGENVFYAASDDEIDD